ncbi:hypothetical protein Tco_0909778 [Tanacetum coccineum]|uniref:Uncharacterized protein n=1 Tax=Tanacetum coccineum TaxID=301880 RepID=A0ABQ5CU83_9ASTR
MRYDPCNNQFRRVQTLILQHRLYHLRELTGDTCFSTLFYEFLNPSPSVDHPTPEVVALINEVIDPVLAGSTGSPSSTIVDQDAPSPSNSQTTPDTQPPIIPNDVDEDNHDIEVQHMFNRTVLWYFHSQNLLTDQSSSSVLFIQLLPLDHDQVYRTANQRNDLRDTSDLTMQEELHEFEHLEVWELVPPPDKALVITLKWIYKVKLDEFEAQWILLCSCLDTPMVEKSKLDEIKEGKAKIRHTNRGTVHRGLWYPKDSSIALTAFANADHAGCQDTRRRTSGSIQLLGDRLVSWSSKRQKSAGYSPYGS